jgi:hypothetical protein
VVAIRKLEEKSGSDVWIFHPADSTWTRGPAIAPPRTQFSALALADDSVLVLGGMRGTYADQKATAVAERLDPKLHEWKPVHPAPFAAETAAAVMLPTGEIMFGTGQDETGECTAKWAMYDPKADRWTTLPDAPAPEVWAKAFVRADGKIELVDGTCNWSSFTATFDPASRSWQGHTTELWRVAATFTQLRDGRVLEVGGELDKRHRQPVSFMFDPARGWSPAAAPPHWRWSHAAVRIGDGRIMAIGGNEAEWRESDAVDLYDPGRDRWVTGAPLPARTTNLAAATLPDGRVLVVGGWIGGLGGHYTGQTWLYTP